MATHMLWRQLRHKQYPWAAALKPGCVNPDYPPKEAAFALRLGKLYTFVFFAGAIGVILLMLSWMNFFDPNGIARAGVQFGLGGTTLCTMACIKYLRVYPRLNAEWCKYVVLRDCKEVRT